MVKYPTKHQLCKKNTGAALITVLVIVFMIMAIITNITVENYRTIRRLSNQKVQAQAQSILTAATSFGRGLLLTSGATSKIDTLSDIWALPIPKSSILDDIQMSGSIIDEQSKFNINDMVSNGMINKTVVTQFTTLLSYLNIPTSIAYSIASYMASPQYEQEIMDQYTTGAPAYRPSGRPLIDLSELILIKGMQPLWVYKLSQYVTAIPQNFDYKNESSTTNQSFPAVSSSTKNNPQQSPMGNGSILVNINTASAEVISAKSGIPLPVAQRIITTRISTPFQSGSDITNFLTSNGIIMSQNSVQGAQNIQISTLTTSSQYFTIHAVVNSGDYEFKLVTLVFRQTRSGKWPQILWQHIE
ncbi:MAG: type II secretion system minor pseudopilin GspK [Proteobacteria bacterium]|nr:type II secretion system minor pseudopilin GspK [Pseudomonadota bacterium]